MIAGRTDNGVVIVIVIVISYSCRSTSSSQAVVMMIWWLTVAALIATLAVVQNLGNSGQSAGCDARLRQRQPWHARHRFHHVHGASGSWCWWQLDY